MIKLVNSELDKIQEKLINIRRALHANPELSGQEEETMSFIAGILESLGLEVKSNIGGFGVTGTLYGKKEGGTIAIRADMDALPVTEKKNTVYKSKKPGVMHACGHDVHMTIAIGSAMILSKLSDKIKGNVKFIFQPCEENVGGSSQMIKEGVLKNPVVDAILGLHILPTIETGKVGIRYGTMMASADKIKIIIKGKSGHAAEPHKTVDAIWVASMVVNAIHHIVSRRIDPLTPSVISLGTIKGGTAPNIIANRVEIVGTLRSLTEDAREKISKTIDNVIKGVTKGMGADYECTFFKGSPPLVNDDNINRLVEKTAESVLGKENVINIQNPTLGGEDFSLYLKKIPGAFFRIGCCNKEKDTYHPLHNDMFDADEDSISVGVKVMTLSAINYLKGNF